MFAIAFPVTDSSLHLASIPAMLEYMGYNNLTLMYDNTADSSIPCY